MDQETIKMAIDLGQFLVTGGIGIWLYIIRKNDTTNERVSALEADVDKRLDDHNTRLARVEAVQRNAVTQQEMSKLSSELSATTMLLKSVQSQLDRIQQWLINKAI